MSLLEESEVIEANQLKYDTDIYIQATNLRSLQH